MVEKQRDPGTVGYDVLDEAGLLAGVDRSTAEREVPGQGCAGGLAAELRGAQQGAHDRLALRDAALRRPGDGCHR